MDATGAVRTVCGVSASDGKAPERLAGYDSLAGPKVSDDLFDAGSFPVHEYVSPQKSACQKKPSHDAQCQHGYTDSELPCGDTGQTQPEHHQHGRTEGEDAEKDPDGAIGKEEE